MFSQRLSDSNTPVDSFLLGPTERLRASVMFCWEIATDVKGFGIFHFTTAPIIQVPTSRIFKQVKFESTQEAHSLCTDVYYRREEGTVFVCVTPCSLRDVPTFGTNLSTRLYGVTSQERVIFKKYINFNLTLNSIRIGTNTVCHYINRAS
jgi:hypothetical protein